MSEYDELLNQLHSSVMSAAKLIPKMCYALKAENLTKDDINDKVTKDCLAAGFSRSTVLNNMPEEFKDLERVESGKKGRQKQLEEEQQKKEMTVTTDGNIAYNLGANLEPEPKLSTSGTAIDRVPEPIASQQQEPQKKQPDYKIIKSGIIPKAFQEIVQEMRQFNYRTDKCKMGLLIYYI